MVDRWNNYLKPFIVEEQWSAAEKSVLNIVQNDKKYKDKWQMISDEYLPSRNSTQIKEFSANQTDANRDE